MRARRTSNGSFGAALVTVLLAALLLVPFALAEGAPGSIAGAVGIPARRLSGHLGPGDIPRFAPAARRISSVVAVTAPTPRSEDVIDVALNGAVGALLASGSDLYVGGAFTDAAGIPEADYLATWDGTRWSALGSGPRRAPLPTPAPMCCSPATPPPTAHPEGSSDGALDRDVYALAFMGTDLYVGGAFTDAAGIPEADHIARWDGSNWSALGSNDAGEGRLGGPVIDLAVAGADLYVGGMFGFEAAWGLARWDGRTWSAVDPAGPEDQGFKGWVFAIALLGDDLYVGGMFAGFTDAAGLPRADRIARWDGRSWSTLGARGSGGGALDNVVPATSVADENLVAALAASGSDLYVGGRFTDAADIPEADHIARWDGTAWSALGSDGAGDGALDGTVLALLSSGSELYVGGDFTDAAGIPEADYLAMWDGNTWSAVAPEGAINGPISALAISGTHLYVGGDFTDAGGIPEADYLAGWDGTDWSALAPDGAARTPTLTVRRQR